MLVSHRRYRIITDRAAIVAAIVLLSTQWFASEPRMTAGDDAIMTTACIESTPLQTPERPGGLSFSELMLDLGLLLFLNR